MLLGTSLKQITFYDTYIDMCNHVAFAKGCHFYPCILPSWVKTISLKLIVVYYPSGCNQGEHRFYVF